MKKRKRTTFKRRRNMAKPASNHASTVRRLAAQGHSGDVISQLLRVNKNTLRAKHALDLAAGRRIARAEAEAVEHEELSAEEETMRRAFFAGFGTDWEFNGVNDLGGLTLAQTEVAWADWLRQHRAGER